MSGRRFTKKPNRPSRQPQGQQQPSARPRRPVTAPADEPPPAAASGAAAALAELEALKRKILAGEAATLGREAHQTTIEDDQGSEHVYTLELLDADLGLEIKGRMGAAFGQLAAVAGEVFAGDGTVGGQALAAGITSMLQRLLVEEGAELFFDLLSGCTRDGQPMTVELFRRAYAGNYGELYLAAWWAFRENFGGIAGRAPFDQILGMMKTLGLMRLKESFGGSTQTSSSDTPSTASPESSDSIPNESDASGP